MRRLLAILLCLAFLPAPARAEIRYYPDPVHKKLSDEDPLPMADVLALAREGDVRAQFIVGDLYAKGKGGMPQDLAEARRWFEESAIHGYGHSFIRLAALAKRDNNPAEAWQWYTLAVKAFGHGNPERKYAQSARAALLEKTLLSGDSLRQARKAVSAWEDLRDRRLREEAKKEKEKKAEAPPAPENPPKPATTGETKHEQN